MLQKRSFSKYFVIYFLLPPSLDDFVYGWICESRFIQLIVAPLSVTVEVNKYILAEFSLVFASYMSCFHHHLEKTLDIL
jgi:hypothetical protein